MSGLRSALPSVLVIIPNNRRIDEAVRAVTSAMTQEYAGRLRVLLVYEDRLGVGELLERLPVGVGAMACNPGPDRNPIAVKRNLALDASDEELIAFLDDDDIWHPKKLAEQAKALRSVPGALGCATGCTAFSAHAPRWQQVISPKVSEVSVGVVLRAGTIATSSMLVDGPMARRLRFDERSEWTAVEDFDLWNRVRERGPILYVAAPLTAICVQPSSDSRRSRSYQHVKTMSVLAARAGQGHDIALRAAAVSRAGVAALSARGTPDAKAERLLGDVLDGRLFGPFDRAVAGAIRRTWRSRRAVPVLFAVRDRTRRVRGHRAP